MNKILIACIISGIGALCFGVGSVVGAAVTPSPEQARRVMADLAELRASDPAAYSEFVSATNADRAAAAKFRYIAELATIRK